MHNLLDDASPDGLQRLGDLLRRVGHGEPLVCILQRRLGMSTRTRLGILQSARKGHRGGDGGAPRLINRSQNLQTLRMPGGVQATGLPPVLAACQTCVLRRDYHLDPPAAAVHVHRAFLGFADSTSPLSRTPSSPGLNL
jgi:hypothetical protein